MSFFGRSAVLSAGQNLRMLREKLGLTMRDVETASARIAQKYANDEFSIAPSRLSDIETKGVIPSIFRIYSLSVIYRQNPRDILLWYGIDLAGASSDLSLAAPPRSHVSESLEPSALVEIPVSLDPAFDPRRTGNLGRMVEKWGVVPASYLAQFAKDSFTYGYIGSEDFTMYPLLLPGAFVQVDESRNRVQEGVWRSEYDRPIYFVETRDGHTCCWCALQRDHLVLQPHPLSPVPVRVLRHPQEAEVIGQIVGVAMKLGDWRHLEPVAATKEHKELN
jgi:hypothetical protein